MLSPERLWLTAIWLRQRGHRWLATRVKQLNSLLYHNSLATGAHVAEDIYLGHHGLGTVIHDNVVIGRGVKIWHNVTLAVRAPAGSPHHIVIGDGVMIGANAVVITPRTRSLHIGAGARVGAGASPRAWFAMAGRTPSSASRRRPQSRSGAAMPSSASPSLSVSPVTWQIATRLFRMASFGAFRTGHTS
jgi:serine O-acetyltransferase